MHPHRPIPFHSRSPDQTQDDEFSDFPSIRERKSSPPPIHSTTNRSRRRSSAVLKDPKRCPSPNQSPLPPRLPRRRLLNKGLGTKNILNTIEVAVRHTKNDNFKSPLKRRLESVDAASDAGDEDHPLKKYRLTSVFEDDMDQIKIEIEDIKTCMEEIVEHLREEVDYKIDKVIRRLAQIS